MKGIITADVVGSTKIPQSQRGMLPEVLQQLVAQLQAICPMRLEIYRGDSFQIVVESISVCWNVYCCSRSSLPVILKE